MASRLELHEKLCEILGNTKDVYFQPPASIKISYPAILYSLNDRKLKRADDNLYLTAKEYMITVITDDPEDELPDKVLHSFGGKIGYDRRYISNNLYHDVFTIIY